MDFETAHDLFIRTHLSVRKSERKKRLQTGHGYGEKLFLHVLWWPLFRHFRDLHPEYEVRDFKDGRRYLDFAFIKGNIKLAIEIDGFGPHYKQLDNKSFSDQLIRQNYLTVDGWFILRFSVDDLRERPRLCQQILQQFMGRYFGMTDHLDSDLDAMEKEILRFASTHDEPVRCRDVEKLLAIGEHKARRLLHGLLDKGWFAAPEEGKSRMTKYTLDPSRLVTF